MSDGQQSLPETPRSNGMPVLGLGTWQNDDHEECVESVRRALEMGYRHIDTAQAYGNEAAVGEGIARSDVPRDDLFLATKVWIDRLDAEGVVESTKRSLDELGVESVDLLYVHWPADEYDPVETMRAFTELHDEGLIDRIGVSNFEPEHIEAAQEAAGAPVFANQVEVHPYLPQEELREVCAEEGIELVAYSPLARGAVFDDPVLTEIAEAHGATVPQVTLAWLRQHGVTAIPKATGEAHQRDNLGSLGVDLTDEEMARIDAIEHEDRRVHPDFAPDAW